MKSIRFAAAVAVFALGTPAFADTLIEGIPTAWRLQNYTGGQINVWYTGSSCWSGSVVMTGTSDENNRFWSTIMSAKLTGRPVGIYYNPANNCSVTSFYLKEQ